MRWSMKRIVILLAVALVAVVGAGCSLDEPALEGEPSVHAVLLEEVNPAGFPALDPYVLLPLDSVIAVSVSEWQDVDDELDDRYVGVYVGQYTDRIYPACNFSIIQNVEVGEQAVVFHHIAIDEPFMQATALGPAFTGTYLGFLEGRHVLEFRYEDRIDTHLLTVTDSTLELNPLDTSYTRPDHRLYWRARPQSFVFLCGTLTEDSCLCSDFMEALQAEIELTEYFISDTGVSAYPRQSMGHYYDAPGRFFVYESEEDYLKAGAVLEAFTHDVIAGRSGTGMSLENWQGLKFRSWLFPGGR
jgi:hypothetical protein